MSGMRSDILAKINTDFMWLDWLRRWIHLTPKDLTRWQTKRWWYVRVKRVIEIKIPNFSFEKFGMQVEAGSYLSDMDHLFFVIIGRFHAVFRFFNRFEFFLFVIVKVLWLLFAIIASAGVFFVLFPIFHGKSSRFLIAQSARKGSALWAFGE